MTTAPRYFAHGRRLSLDTSEPVQSDGNTLGDGIGDTRLLERTANKVSQFTFAGIGFDSRRDDDVPRYR